MTSRVKSILTMCINFISHSMCLSKHHEHGINALGIFSFTIILGLVKRILHSSLEGWAKIYLHVKYMLITLSLVLLIKPFVMSLAKS
jgi:hypothetical protein